MIWVRNYHYWPDLQILPRSSTTSEQCEVSSLFCLLLGLGIRPPSFYRGSWRPVYAWFDHIRIAKAIHAIKCGDWNIKPSDLRLHFTPASNAESQFGRFARICIGAGHWISATLLPANTLICQLPHCLASRLACYIYPNSSENVPPFPNDNQHAAGKCK